MAPGDCNRAGAVQEEVFRPQLGEPHHHAYVVEDIEATVGRLVDQLGAGPFFLVENVPLENVLSRGEPATFAHHSAFGFSSGGAIELMQVVDLAPERVEQRFAAPRPRIHHLAYDLEIHVDCQGLRDFFGMVKAAAEGWDVSNPLRPVAG